MPRPMLLVLAGALLVGAVGLQWGLPSEHGWAPDELLPPAIEEAASRHFAGGWHAKYPPVHFALLAIAHAPVRVAARAAGLDASGVHHALMVTSRVVSLLMGLGTLLALFAATRRLVGDLAAAAGCALAACSVPFVYATKIANVDVPYLFWFGLALLMFVRARESGRTRDLVLYAVFAAMAIGTKDQAYALFLLPSILLVRHLGRASGSGWRVLGDRRLLAAALAGAAALLLTEGALFNPSGFAAHVSLITGSASDSFRMYPASLLGVLAVLAQTLRHLAFALGWPAFVACVMGIVWMARWREDQPLVLLSFAASYVVFFLAVAGYVYDRFLLPVILVVAPLGGWGLVEAGRRWRRAGAAASTAIIVHAFLRAASVDVLLVRDSRYDAERWLVDHAKPDTLLAAVGPLEYLPRMRGLTWRRLGPAASRLEQVKPALVVVNGDYARRADEGTGERAFYAGLEDGTLGYELAYRHRARPPSLIDTETLQREGRDKIWSNLDKVNPEIRIYRRASPDP